MRRFSSVRISILTVWALGCGSPADPTPDGGETCAVAADCDDGVFCNGSESCDPGAAGADARGCVAGDAPCADACDEESGSCSDCDAAPDADGDGAVARACGGNDCDDDDPSVNPSAVEVCDADGVDEDCDPVTFGFRDQDMDGTPDATCCNGAVCGTDCNDVDGRIGPGFAEVCDGIDNDCDGSNDEGALTRYYADTDGDDFGDPDGEVRMSCSQPSGFSENDRDCNDMAASVNPSAPDVCDGVGDNDCNESTTNPFDTDGDGQDAFDATSCPTGNDCNDDDETVYSGAPELCDGVDTNCDGAETFDVCNCTGRCTGGCPFECENPQPDGSCDGTCLGPCFGTCDGTCTTVGDPYEYSREDMDQDGFLELDATCSGGPLDGLPRTDCWDDNAGVYPGARESCNLIDDDCDGVVDEDADTYHSAVPLEVVTPDPTFSGATSADLGCMGALILEPATPGATTVVPVIGRSGPLGSGVMVEYWDGPDATSTTCGTGCTTHVTDSSGTITITDGSSPMATFVVRPGGATPPSLVQVPMDAPDGTAPSLAGLYPYAYESLIDEAGLWVELADCGGSLLRDFQVRVHRATACGTERTLVGSWLTDSAFLATDFSPSLTAAGELVTVEAWGRRTARTAPVLLARERVRVRAGTLTMLTMLPLRADGPPAP